MNLYRRWQIFKISLLFFRGTPIIFAAIFTASCAAILWFFLHLIDVKKHGIHQTLELEAAKIEGEILNRVDHTFALIQDMNAQIIKDPFNKTHINNILSKYKPDHKLSDEFSWSLFSWANPHHHIVVDSFHGIMKETHNISMRDYMASTVEKPAEFHLGKPVLGTTSKKWIIPGGVGLVDDNGKYLGALIIGFKIDSLSKALNDILDNDNVSFELMSQDNVVVLYGYKPSFNLSKGSFKEKEIINYMLEELRYSASGSSLSDIALFKDRHAMMSKRIEHFPYYLILRYDDKALQDELLKSFTSRFFTIFLLSIIVILLFIFIYKREKIQSQKIADLKKLTKDK